MFKIIAEMMSGRAYTIAVGEDLDELVQLVNDEADCGHTDQSYDTEINSCDVETYTVMKDDKWFAELEYDKATEQMVRA